MEVKCTDSPKLDLYSFNAELKIVYKHTQKNIDLDLRQFIPRGSHVRNSQCLYLLVIYTGPETKLILNQGKYKIKMSRLDKMVNIFLGWNVALMLTFSFLLSYGCYNFVGRNYDSHSYIY